MEPTRTCCPIQFMLKVPLAPSPIKSQFDEFRMKMLGNAGFNPRVGKKGKGGAVF